MAFEIGERVKSSFTGEGTVISDMLPNEPGEPREQEVQFDHATLGRRRWQIGKLSPVNPEGGGDGSN